jgi:hypothetical protein
LYDIINISKDKKGENIMSHYLVGVVVNDISEVDDILAPYDEELEVEPYTDDDGETTTYNPNSKWDWYSIGGRFSDGKPTKIKDFKLYDDLDNDTLALYKRAWDSFEGKSELSEEDNNAIFGGFRMWNDKYYLDRYGTCENYIKAMSSNIPYAFVDANGWYEKGQMGWWGCDNATQESIEDYTEFAEKYFTTEENQNKYIVWVDCHI